MQIICWKCGRNMHFSLLVPETWKYYNCIQDNMMIFWLVLCRSKCLLQDLWKWWQSFLNATWWSNQSGKLFLLESEFPLTFLTTFPHFHDFASNTGHHKWGYFSSMSIPSNSNIAYENRLSQFYPRIPCINVSPHIDTISLTWSPPVQAGASFCHVLFCFLVQRSNVFLVNIILWVCVGYNYKLNP